MTDFDNAEQSGTGLKWENTMADQKDDLAEARTLLTEAIEEIKRLRKHEQYLSDVIGGVINEPNPVVAGSNLYRLLGLKEPLWVSDWHKSMREIGNEIDELIIVMEWLREDKKFVQADRLRTLIGRIARAIPSYPVFDGDNLSLQRNIARTYGNQLSPKESKAAENLIQELKAQLIAAVEAHDAILEDAYKLEARAEAAEAKLAVAVEALEDQLRSDEAEVRVFYTSGQANPPVERRIDRTCATLAEIKGEKP